MEKIDEVFEILSQEVKKYKVPVVDLIKVQTGSPFKILVATLLSARTNDRTTSEVCERLFKKISNVDDFDKFSEEEIADMIFPVGFYKNKASYLKKLPGELNERFGGIIPQTIDELVTLPGVGRKTANLVLAQAFEIPAICVDVHVHRILNRIGYVRTKTPLETEMRLRKKLPKKYWIPINTIFVMFGQYLCRPVSPKCSICPIENLCAKKNLK
ncbi:MAG: endonuclease III [Spirochaetales bacterium]|nr:endonuclease III [Spirochaetales bacterium]